MKVKMTTLMLGISAMLASCGNEDVLQSENNGEFKAVTITASLPEGMTTRAVGSTDDSQVVRCYVQMLDEQGNELADGYSTVVKMDESIAGKTYTAKLWMNPTTSEKYTLLFWADSDNSASAPTTLKNVAYNNSGEVVAFAGNLKNQGYVEAGINCTLKHAVTRISVNTTTDLSVTDDATDPYTLTLTVPTSFTAYNVLTGTVAGDATVNWVYNCPVTTVTGATAAVSKEICHFYVMPDANGGNQDLQLHYCGELDNPAITLPNAPINPNFHIIYQGDVAHAGLKQVNISASVDENWGDGSSTTDF